jgi:hypothetical protein
MIGSDGASNQGRYLERAEVHVSNAQPSCPQTLLPPDPTQLNLVVEGRGHGATEQQSNGGHALSLIIWLVCFIRPTFRYNRPFPFPSFQIELGWGRGKKMDYFLQGLAAVSPILPWLVRAILVGLALIAAWVLLSIPGFWLCRALAPFLWQGMTKLAELSHKLLDRGVAVFKTMATPINEFVVCHAQAFSFADENSQVVQSIRALREKVKAIPDRIDSLETILVDAEKRFSKVSDSIASVELPASLEAPTAQQFAAIQVADNHSVVKLILAAVLSPGLMAINTGMLTEFFDSLWPGLEFHGLPIAQVLAFLFTIAEFASGAFIVYSGTLIKGVLLVGVSFLALIEFACYARLGQGFSWSPFEAFYPPGAAPVWTTLWFGGFGIAIVALLAVAGHTFVEAIKDLRTHHVVKQWKEYIGSRMANATALRERLEDAERAKTVLKKSLDEVSETFRSTKEGTNSALAIIAAAKADFLSEIEKAGLIRLEDQRQLGRGSMLRIYFQSLFFVGAAVVALIVGAVVFAIFPAPQLLSFLGARANLFMSAAEVAILLTAGAASSRENATLPSVVGNAPSNVRHSNVGLIMGGGIVAAIVLANAFYLLQPFSWSGAALWAAMVGMDLGLFWLGTRLGVIVAAVWATIHAGVITIFAGLLIIASAAVRIAWIMLATIRVSLFVLAFPFSVLFLKDPTGSKLLERATVA